MEPIRTILVTVDSSPTAAPAIEVAKGLARGNGGARLVLHHAADRRCAGGSDVFSALRDELLRTGGDRLRELAGGIGLEGIDHEMDVTCGSPPSSILSVRARVGADLVVIGDSSFDDYWQRAVGPTARRVLGEAPAHVLMVHRRCVGGGGGPPIRRMLVAVGPSDADLEVLACAARVRSLLEGELQVLHVSEENGGPPMTEARLRERWAEQLAREVRDAVDALRVRRAAHPVAGILAAAQELEADLIAFGTAARGGFFRAPFAGRVSSRLIRRAGCSLLAVRRPARWGRAGRGAGSPVREPVGA